MTGAYLRVQRDGAWIAVEVEHLTPEERRLLLGPASKEKLHSWIEALCATIRAAEAELCSALGGDMGAR